MTKGRRSVTLIKLSIIFFCSTPIRIGGYLTLLIKTSDIKYALTNYKSFISKSKGKGNRVINNDTVKMMVIFSFIDLNYLGTGLFHDLLRPSLAFIFVILRYLVVLFALVPAQREK